MTLRKSIVTCFTRIIILSFICCTAVQFAYATSFTLDEKTLDVKFRQIIPLPEDYWDDVDVETQEETKGILTTAGWIYNDREHLFERYVTYNHVDVAIQEGDAALHNTLDDTTFRSNTQPPLEVNVFDPITGKTYTQTIGRDSVDAQIVIDLDISKMFAIDISNKFGGDGNNVKASPTDPYWTDGEKGVYGYRLHCNRFNGFLGDGKYYANDISPKALKNFANSDCDIALARSSICLQDHTSNPHCAAKPESKQASCSSDIGHYNRFHMHTTYYNPKDWGPK